MKITDLKKGIKFITTDKYDYVFYGYMVYEVIGFEVKDGLIDLAYRNTKSKESNLVFMQEYHLEKLEEYRRPE